VRLALDPYIKYLTPKGNLFWYRGRFLRNQNENNTNQSSTNFIFYNDFMYQRTLAKKFNWTSGVTFNAFVADGNIYQGRKTGNNVAVYSQLDGKLGRLTTNLGFRLETILMDTLERETRPVFRAGLNYKIAEGTNVRASIGQAFRFPSVAERFTNTEAGRIIIEANPNLQSETGYSAEIAFRQGFRFRGANSLFRGYVDVAGFYTDFNNMVEFGLKDVDFVFAPDLQLIATFKSVNVARARIMGVEVTGNMEGQWGDWYASFNGGITLLDPQNLNAVPEAEQTDLTGFQEDVESGDIIRLLDALNSLDDTTTTDSPPILKYRNRVTVRASASIGYKKLTFTTNVRHRDFMESIDQYLFPVVPDLNYFRTRVNPNGNTAFDFILAYRPTENNEISLNVSNAFNEEYLVVPGRLGEQRQFTFQYLIRF
jgi:outer membrane receptor protein involved in Fe transport